VSLDPSFHRSALVARIVRGAGEPDPVRLHGAIVAALELYSRTDAMRGVFAPALRATRAEYGRDCRDRAAAAIRDHIRLDGWPPLADHHSSSR
jgi:hypothetical protein